MSVSDSMIAADKVYTCTAQDTIATVLEIMSTRHISAVVVVNTASIPTQAMGMVEKSDLLLAYLHQVPINQPIQLLLERQQIKTLMFPASESRNVAARAMEQKLCHHALVLDNNGHFVGLLSAWDLAAHSGQPYPSWLMANNKNGRMIHTEPAPVTVVFPSVEDSGW